MKPGMKLRKEKQEIIVNWPSVTWEGGDQALTWDLIELMQLKYRYWAGIWSRPGDKTVGRKKIPICMEIALELLSKEPRSCEIRGVGETDISQVYTYSIDNRNKKSWDKQEQGCKIQMQLRTHLSLVQGCTTFGQSDTHSDDKFVEREEENAGFEDSILLSDYGLENLIAKSKNPSRTVTSELKRALPSQMHCSKCGRDDELSAAWLRANMVKNDRKRTRDELE
ncbi:hypothetical protein HOY82DRAFT_537451 [Tuber indicum]|nr:hypothetical protein HOY82DRAFT_537451 [Tuber indicum]